jgi:hypothetical protein
MRCDYRCGHVRCRGCEVVERGVRVYFRCCNCKKLRPLSRTGNKHNNRTKISRRAKDKRRAALEAQPTLPPPTAWFIGPRGIRKEKGR